MVYHRLKKTLLYTALLVSSVTVVGCEDTSWEFVPPDTTEEPTTYVPENASSITFSYKEQPGEFFDSPWPSNNRLNKQGNPDLSDFPERKTTKLIDQYATSIERATGGYSIMPIFYFPLTAKVPLPSLPSESESTTTASPITLRKVLPTCGEPVPIETKYIENGGTYQPSNTLAGAPSIGHPLTPGHTYAVTITDSFRDGNGSPIYAPELFFEQFMEASSSSSDSYEKGLAALRNCQPTLAKYGTLRAATVFTVQNPAKSLRKIAQVTRSEAEKNPPQIRELTHLPDASKVSWNTYEGVYDTPIFMTGESPYSTGGQISYDESGQPIIQRMEEVPFTVAIPDNTTKNTPIILWSGGTGATIESHLNDQWFYHAIDAGFAVFTYAPQFHDDRATEGSSEIGSTFNYLNPDAGRTVFRQQAIDTVYFLEVIRRSAEHALNDISVPIDLDENAVVYGGHSQGGLVGVLVSAIEPRFHSFTFSGTGAYTSMTVLKREEPFDIKAVLRALLSIDGSIDRFHPAVQLVQLGADAVDPHSYLHAWHGSDKNPEGSSVFVINGDQDSTTHVDAINHLTIATGLTPIQPAGWQPAYLENDSVDPQPPPITETTSSNTGTPLTHVTWLEGGGGHFTLYDRNDVPQLVISFMTSSLSGVPQIPEFTRDP